jgi:hypothetical protein
MKEKILRLNLYIGLFAFLSSTLLLVLRIPFMKTWFFCFAWWSLILFLDSWNFRRQRSSLLSGSFGKFLFMAYLSVFIWVIFELFNLRLKNWSYHSLPLHAPERWAGYFLAFASVVPALKELSLLFGDFLKGKSLALFKISPRPIILWGFFLLGLLSVFFVLLWPKIFFPLPWMCFIFLLDPINYWLRNDSILEGFETGDWIRFWSWVLAGLVAGFLWELWNFWAGSHWEYSLPHLDFGRVFHMPVLGYTGFLPFSLEVFSLSTFLSVMKERLQQKTLLNILIFMALGLFCLVGFYLIDRFTLMR